MTCLNIYFVLVVMKPTVGNGKKEIICLLVASVLKPMEHVIQLILFLLIVIIQHTDISCIEISYVLYALLKKNVFHQVNTYGKLKMMYVNVLTTLNSLRESNNAYVHMVMHK